MKKTSASTVIPPTAVTYTSANKVEIAETTYYWKSKTDALVKKKLTPHSKCDWKKLYYDLVPLTSIKSSSDDRVLKLSEAIINKDVCLIMVLIQIGVVPNSAGIVAASKSTPEIMNILLTSNASKKITIPYKSLTEAINTGNTEIVLLLLNDRRVDVVSTEEYGTDAIIHAVTTGNMSIVNLLLADKRVDPSVEKNRAIYTAAYNNNIQMTKALLRDPRVDPSSSSADPVGTQYLHYNGLIAAAEVGNIEVVKILLSDSRTNPFTIPPHILRKIEQNRKNPAPTKNEKIPVKSQHDYIEVARLINMAVYGDKVRGMFLGYYSVTESVNETEIITIYEAKTGYSRYLKYMVNVAIRKGADAKTLPSSVLNEKIGWLSSNLKLFTKSEITEIYDATIDLLYNGEINKENNEDLYSMYVIMGGFMEICKDITVNEILEELSRYGHHVNNIVHVAMLLGAHLGYNKYLSSGIRQPPSHLLEVADNYTRETDFNL